MTTDLEVINFNQSRIKTFAHCPKEYEYKYVQNLEPRRKVRPLFLGSWVHACLETHYRDGDWTIGHREYVAKWDKLFKEEQIALRTRGNARNPGPPFPEIVERIMKSYLWYHREGDFKAVMVEQILEVETPLKIGNKRFVFKGRLDLIAEDTEGKLWLVDHKTAGTIPPPTSFHGMDPQLMLYPWAAKIQYGIDLAGVMYNYVKSKPPTMPQINKDGSLSKRKINTDYPTLYRFLKRNGYNPNDFAHILKPMARRSEFLRRYPMPREPHVTREILLDTLSRVKTIDDITTRGGRFTRTITRECGRCSYHDLCRSELNGFDTEIMRNQNFTVSEEDYVVGNHAGSEEADDEDDEGSEGD
jgi:hypothetical protein